MKFYLQTYRPTYDMHVLSTIVLSSDELHLLKSIKVWKIKQKEVKYLTEGPPMQRNWSEESTTTMLKTCHE